MKAVVWAYKKSSNQIDWKTILLLLTSVLGSLDGCDVGWLVGSVRQSDNDVLHVDIVYVPDGQAVQDDDWTDE